MVKASKATPNDEYTVTPVTEKDGAYQSNSPNATAGASAAGIRAVTMQAMAFYFRTPIKAFFRTRVDYMTIARAVAPIPTASAAWSWRYTTPGLLANAVQHYGWRFIPDQVLPPLIANATVGAVLYTSYLTILGSFWEPASISAKRVYPPAPMADTFAAGMAAGAIQSVIAAPLDAIQVRFSTREILDKQYRSIWRYSREKLFEIGPRGVMAGWSLSLLKDSFGNGLFFLTFETLKSQVFYSFVTTYYGIFRPTLQTVLEPQHWFGRSGKRERPVIRPHYLLEPSAILVAGVAASVAQQTVQHPLTLIQNVHYGRLESLDFAAKQEMARVKVLRLYYASYQETFRQCKLQASKVGGWKKWLYRDFVYNTIRQVPSTAAGLVVFEVLRRKYATGYEVRIKKDGYDILLT